MTGIREGWIAERKTASVRNQNGGNMKVFLGFRFPRGPCNRHFERSVLPGRSRSFRPGRIHHITRPRKWSRWKAQQRYRATAGWQNGRPAAADKVLRDLEMVAAIVNRTQRR